MYQLICPECRTVHPTPFVRIGAVAVCRRCGASFPVTEDNVKRLMTTSSMLLEESLLIDPAEAKAHAPDADAPAAPAEPQAEEPRADAPAPEDQYHEPMPGLPPVTNDYAADLAKFPRVRRKRTPPARRRVQTMFRIFTAAVAVTMLVLVLGMIYKLHRDRGLQEKLRRAAGVEVKIESPPPDDDNPQTQPSGADASGSPAPAPAPPP